MRVIKKKCRNELDIKKRQRRTDARKVHVRQVEDRQSSFFVDAEQEKRVFRARTEKPDIKALRVVRLRREKKNVRSPIEQSTRIRPCVQLRLPVDSSKGHTRGQEAPCEGGRGRLHTPRARLYTRGDHVHGEKPRASLEAERMYARIK